MNHNNPTDLIIADAVERYAEFHDVTADDVDVCEEYATADDGSQHVTRFRLSLDVDGRSRGCDEWYEAEAPE